MGRWSNLTALQKATIIQMAADNGNTDLNEIIKLYDEAAKTPVPVYNSGVMLPEIEIVGHKHAGTDEETSYLNNVPVQQNDNTSVYVQEPVRPISLRDTNPLLASWVDLGNQQLEHQKMMESQGVIRDANQTKRREFLEQAVNTMSPGANYRPEAMSDEMLYGVTQNRANAYNTMLMAANPAVSAISLGTGLLGGKAAVGLNHLLGSPIDDYWANVGGNIIGGFAGGRRATTFMPNLRASVYNRVDPYSYSGHGEEIINIAGDMSKATLLGKTIKPLSYVEKQSKINTVVPPSSTGNIARDMFLRDRLGLPIDRSNYPQKLWLAHTSELKRTNGLPYILDATAADGTNIYHFNPEYLPRVRLLSEDMERLARDTYRSDVFTGAGGKVGAKIIGNEAHMYDRWNTEPFAHDSKMPLTLENIFDDSPFLRKTVLPWLRRFDPIEMISVRPAPIQYNVNPIGNDSPDIFNTVSSNYNRLNANDISSSIHKDGGKIHIAPSKRGRFTENLYNRIVPIPALMPHGPIIGGITQYLKNSDSAVQNFLNNFNLEESIQAIKDNSKYKYMAERLEPFLLEDLKDLYLGMPQRNNTFELSKYKPSNATESNYYHSPVMENTLAPHFISALNDIKTGNIKPSSDKFGSGQYFDIQSITPSGNAVTILPGLGHATLGNGYDNGEYISYYDKWNVGNFTPNTDFILDKFYDVPNIYGRIYLDDYYNVPEEKRGATFLPEITVSPQYKDGGSIHIKPSKRGTFTAAATKHGKSVQEFARQVLANKDNYSPAMVKKANFARNAAHWHAPDENDSQSSYLNTQGSVNPAIILEMDKAVQKIMDSGWFKAIKSTGGPLYPFSFQKNPYWKTPVVRYDNGGELSHKYGLGDFLSKLFARTYNGDFNTAFANARLDGRKFFKWNGNRYNTQLRYEKYREEHPEEFVPEFAYTDAMDRIVREENQKLSKNGYIAELDAWQPHKSVEGGAETVAYGLKLDSHNQAVLDELEKNKNKKYPKGYISNDFALQQSAKLLKDEYESLAKKYWNSTFKDGSWDKLTPKIKSIILDYQYNVNGGIKTFPKLMKAIHDVDHEGIKANYKRYTGGKELGRNKGIIKELEGLFNGDYTVYLSNL